MEHRALLIRLLISRVKGGSTVLPFAPETGFQIVAGYPDSGSFATMQHKQHPLPQSFRDLAEICLLCSKFLLPEIRSLEENRLIWEVNFKSLEENHLMWEENLLIWVPEMSPGLHQYFLDRATVFSEWKLLCARLSFQNKADMKRRKVSLPSILLFSYYLFAMNAWWHWCDFFFSCSLLLLLSYCHNSIFSCFVFTEK